MMGNERGCEWNERSEWLMGGGRILATGRHILPAPCALWALDGGLDPWAYWPLTHQALPSGLRLTPVPHRPNSHYNNFEDLKTNLNIGYTIDPELRVGCGE